MKYIFTFFTSLISLINLAQCPTSSNFVLRGQEEIDAFPINYPNCHELDHTLNVRGFEVTNIDSLYNIQKINGSLRIEGIEDLQNFDGLDNLQSVGKDLVIGVNMSPLEITGFPALDSIHGKLSINDTKFSPGISGFDNLKYVGGDFIISECDQLEHISAFNQLNYIGGNILVRYLDKLVDFLGLANLETVGGGVLMYDLDNLQNLDGFASLRDFDYQLTINNNRSLTDISGLDSLRIDIGNKNREVRISKNDALSLCNTYFLCQAINVDNYLIHVQSNASGCFHYYDLEESCAAMSVDDIDGPASIKVYPNPAKSNIFIDHAKPVQEIEIYDSSGKLLMTTHNTKIDVSNLKPALYYVLIHSEDNKWIERRFIKN